MWFKLVVERSIVIVKRLRNQNIRVEYADISSENNVLETLSSKYLKFLM